MKRFFVALLLAVLAAPAWAATASSGGTTVDDSPWSRDHNFIAPPQ